MLAGYNCGIPQRAMRQSVTKRPETDGINRMDRIKRKKIKLGEGT
jgi:hypothetical protein